VQLQLANDDDVDDTRRRLALPTTLAQKMGINESDLIELATPGCGAALRVWARIGQREGDDEDTLHLGPQGFAVLGATPGERVEIRVVQGVLS
jgi:hypothetical protein